LPPARQWRAIDARITPRTKIEEENIDHAAAA
jgi:hypothetical protein